VSKYRINSSGTSTTVLVKNGRVAEILKQVDWEGHWEKRETGHVMARVQCLPKGHPDYRDAAYGVQVRVGERVPQVLVELRAHGLEEVCRRFLQKKVGFDTLRRGTNRLFWGS